MRSELLEGRSFRLPDGRVGRVGRCRLCGAEVIYAYNAKTRRTPIYDPVDGAPHLSTCSDAADDRERAER